MIASKSFNAWQLPPNGSWRNEFNRWYDPAVGRWISEDPIGFEGSQWNLYEYTNGQPLKFTDPTGKVRVDTGVKTCGGYSTTDLFSTIPPHGFIAVNGQSCGRLEVKHRPCGSAEIRDDEFDIYPNVDPDTLGPGEWYSDCEPVYLDNECFDLEKFKQSVRDSCKKHKDNPGFYCVRIRDCNTFVDEVWIDAINDARISWFCLSGIADVFQ